MKKLLFLLCLLTISNSALPFFDDSPSLIISNTTDLDFSCKIEIVCDELTNKELIIDTGSFYELTIEFDNLWESRQEGDPIKGTIFFSCMAQQTKTIQTMFYQNDILFKPTVTSVSFTHEALQITKCAPIKNCFDRYFSIDYHPEYGLTSKSTPISMHIKYISNFKIILQSLLVSALCTVNSLPY